MVGFNGGFRCFNSTVNYTARFGYAASDSKSSGSPRMLAYAIVIASAMVSDKVKLLTDIVKSGSLEDLKSMRDYKEGGAWQFYENSDEAGDIFDLAMTETSQVYVSAECIASRRKKKKKKKDGLTDSIDCRHA